MEIDGQIQAPTALTPNKTPVTHCRGGWVGTREGLDDCKASPPLVFDLRTVQSVAGRYTDYAIPVHIFQGISVLEGV